MGSEIVALGALWSISTTGDLRRSPGCPRPRVIGLLVDSYPLRSPAYTAGTDKALVLELSEHETNGLIAHCWYCSPHVRHLERGSGMVEHVVPHPVLLGNSRPVVIGTRRERLVSIGDHVNKETEPWPGIVHTVLPAGGRCGKRVVISVTSFVDDSLEGDVMPHAIADLGEQTRAEQAREPPVAVDEGVDSEEIEREQSDK